MTREHRRFDPGLVRVAVTGAAAVVLLVLLIVFQDLSYWTGGNWQLGLGIVMAAWFLYGVLAPSRATAAVAIALVVPLAAIGLCGWPAAGPNSSCGDGDLGFAGVATLFGMYVGVPALLGVLLGLELGTRWEGGRLRFGRPTQAR